MLNFYGSFNCIPFFKCILIGVLLLFSSSNCISQITSSPIIHNYNVKDHGGSMSNFSIVQDKQGVLYFGNINGVIKFNGNEWKLLKGIGGQTVFDLATTNSNSILVGNYGDFGFYSIDNSGKEKYTTLIDKVFETNISYKICTINNDIYLIGLKEIIHIKGIELVARIPISIAFSGESYFVHKEELYVLDSKLGLCIVGQDKLISVDQNSILKDERIIDHVSIKNTTLILCRSGKLIEYNTVFKEYPIVNNSLSEKLEIEVPVCLDINQVGDTYNIAIGTQKNGIYIIQNNQLQYNINQFNGLINNDVRDVHFTENVLWASTQNGISRIDGIHKWKFWNPNNQDIGLIWEMKKFNNDLYISTTKGVYKLKDDVIKRIGNTVSRSYNFFVMKDRLYLNSFSGIYKIHDDNVSKVLDLDKPNLAQPLDDEKILVISFEGILLVSFNDSGYISSSKKISDLGGMSFSGTIHKNDYWFSLVNSGIFKLSLTDPKYEVIPFTNSQGLPSNSAYEVLTYDNELLISSNNGYYSINPDPLVDSSTFFIPNKSLQSDTGKIQYPIVDFDNNLWYVSNHNDNLEIIKKASLSNHEIEISAPLQAINNQGVTKILPDVNESGIIWVATSQGLYRYNDNIEEVKSPLFYTVFSYVLNNDSIIFNGAFGETTNAIPQFINQQPNSFIPVLDYAKNNLQFEYASTNYESPELTTYSYYLEGYENDWSTWSKSSNKEYTNLNDGTYKFHVKSRNLNNIESTEAVYQFIISPPWYLKLWAITLFMAIGVSFMWLVILGYTNRLRIKRRQLAKMVDEKTQELLIQKEEIEEQNKALVKQKHEIAIVNSELKESNNTKDKLFSIISHDLKGPINSLTAFSNLLSNHSNHMSAKEIEVLAKDFDKTLKNTYNLLDNLLVWSLSQSNAIKLKPARINLKEIIYECVELLESQAKDKNIKVKTNLTDPISAFADLNSIKLVLRNLLSNAIKFTHPKGQIDISIKKDREIVILSIKDSGIGISMELQQQIFEINSKISTEGTSNEKGTGLGLILCKEFVEKNGGKLWLESEEGVSTTFYFSLPIK